MANFTVARYTDTTKLPIQDGRFLVEKTHGLISMDIGNERIPSQYVYGTIKPISTNNWIPAGDRYYIDVTDLMAEELPSSHYVVGASLLSGSYSNTLIHESNVRIYSDDRVTGSILVFALPGTSHNTESSNYSLSSLFHFEDQEGAPVNCSGAASITENAGWSYNKDYKYGRGSVAKASFGYLEIQGIQSLDAFTIEWWQYDPSPVGDGGVILSDASGSIECPPVASTSSKYVSGDWKHFALVRKSGSSVRIYMNGELIGFSQLEGTVDSPITFYGTQAADGTGKVCYLDELAIFNYAKYNENFDVPRDPYVGSNEVLIAVSTDIIDVNTVGEDVTIALPIKLSNNEMPTLDTSSFGSDITVISTDGTSMTIHPELAACGKYEIIVRYPGSISKTVYINVNNPNNISNDTISVDGATYAMSDDTEDREWDGVDYIDSTTAISISDGESSTVYIMEDENATGADRIWSM